MMEIRHLLEDEARLTLADGKDYIVSSLTIDQVIEAESLIGPLASGFSDARAARDNVVKVIGFALARRHPEITPEQIGGQLLTMRNLAPSLHTIFGLSGMATQPGEAKAGQA